MTVVPGLRMLGTPIPIEAASGYQPFDATRTLLEDQGHPVAQRATSTLLLQLRSHAVEPPGKRGRPDDYFFEIWGELARRGLPVESVLRAAIAPAMAASLVRLLCADLAYDFPDWQKAFRAAQVMVAFTDEAYERWFSDRAAEWLARLLDTDSRGFLMWRSAPAPLLASMPSPGGDDDGHWIWDRFTQSHVHDWSTTSLIHEWNFLKGGTELGQVAIRTIKARIISAERVSEVVMSRLAGPSNGTSEPRDLSATQFTRQAMELLESGRSEDAADIFAALAVVNPADGEALNNLGFCLLPTEPSTASRVLERASALPSPRAAINTANLAFAHHLLGNDSGALVLLEQATTEPDPGAVVMWVERACGEFGLASLTSISEYIDLLGRHIRETADIQIEQN